LSPHRPVSVCPDRRLSWVTWSPFAITGLELYSGPASKFS
jgi:hypothetical protein